MCSSCSVHTDGVWRHLAKGRQFNTPDNLTGTDVEISNAEIESIIRIQRRAFESTMDIFLLMEDTFHVGQLSGEVQLIFDHATAQSHFGCSIFWLSL
jgi:hypothetical protein